MRAHGNPRHRRRLNRDPAPATAAERPATIEALETRRLMDGGSAPIIGSVEPIDFQTSKVTFQLSQDNARLYPTLVAHSAQMTYFGPDLPVTGVEFDSDTGRGWGVIPTYWGTNYQITFWSVYVSGESDAEAQPHSVTPPAPPAPSDFSNEAVYGDGQPAVLGYWQRNGTGFSEHQWYYGDKSGDEPTFINDYDATSTGQQSRQVAVQFPGEHRIGVQNFIFDPDNGNQETRSEILSGASVLIKPPPPSAPSAIQVMHDTTPDDIRVTVMEDNRAFAKTGYELQREDVAKHNWQTIWFGFPRSDDEQSQDVIDAAVPIGPTYRYRVRAVAPDVNGNLIDGDWIEGGDVATTHHYFVAWSTTGSQTTNVSLHFGIGEQPSAYKDGRLLQGGSGTSIVFTLPSGMHWMNGGGSDPQQWTWSSPSSYNVLFDDAMGPGTYGITYTIWDGGTSVQSGTLYVRVLSYAQATEP
jgi:hypothetical protein